MGLCYMYGSTEHLPTFRTYKTPSATKRGPNFRSCATRRLVGANRDHRFSTVVLTLISASILAEPRFRHTQDVRSQRRSQFQLTHNRIRCITTIKQIVCPKCGRPWSCSQPRPQVEYCSDKRAKLPTCRLKATNTHSVFSKSRCTACVNKQLGLQTAGTRTTKNVFALPIGDKAKIQSKKKK